MKNLFKITWRSLFLNKKRTFVTILSVILSATLLFTVSIILSSIYETEYQRMNYGDTHKWHLKVPNFDMKDKDKLGDADVIVDYVENIGNEEEPINVQVSEFNYSLICSPQPRTYQKENEVVITKKFSEQYTDKTIEIRGKTYNIVGICTHESIIETTSIYKAPYKDKNNALIYFRNTKNIYKRLELIGEDLNWKKSYIGQGQVSFETKDELPILINKDLLSLNGHREASPEYALQSIALLVLSVVFGGYCVIIVYNSFCISVSDRKKMFGLLTSMGGTKTDIALSVIAEAFIVGLIALPFGFLLSIAVSYYGISTINNINQLNRDFSQLIFSIDWSYIGISCLFIAIVLFFGISRNATMATNTSPIESILKLNNIKMKKPKKHRLMTMLFGIEGKLAAANLKREKSKYQITIATIAICLILFITATTFVNFAFRANMINEANDQNFNSMIMLSDGNFNEFYEKIKKIESIKIVDKYSVIPASIEVSQLKVVNEENIKYYLDNSNNNVSAIKVGLFYDHSSPAKENKIIDEFRNIVYMEEFDKLTTFQEKMLEKGDIYENIKIKNYIAYDELPTDNVINLPKLKVISMEKKYMEILNTQLHTAYVILDTDSYKNSNMKENSYINFTTDDPYKTQIALEKLAKEYKENGKSFIFNVTEYSYFMIDMQIRTINFILYGIIALLLILTLTSIVNTVNGSIDNRRREFAVIKSVGIDDKSFHKMIFLESTIIAFKGIISGLVISYILVKWSMIKYNNLILVVAVDSNDMKLIEFPIKEALIGVSFILAIMTITYIFALNKTKKDNIIDTIRNDNV